MQSFQPASVNLGVFPGDTFDLAIRLYLDAGGGTRVPLLPSPGEVFSLTFGRTVCTTGDTGPGQLLTVEDTDDLRFVRQFSTVETGRLAQPGAPLLWSFVRLPTTSIRRTYVHGAIQLVSATGLGAGDRDISLTVSEGGVIVDLVGVADAASYTDAREAAIRQDMAAAIADAENFAAAAALLLG